MGFRVRVLGWGLVGKEGEDSGVIMGFDGGQKLKLEIWRKGFESGIEFEGEFGS